MKRFIYLSLLSFSIFAMFSYSGGVFTADYTGSTGLGQSCAQTGCHMGIGSMGVDTDKIRIRVLDAGNNDVWTYGLNQLYTVEIRFRLDGATKVGLQSTPLFLFLTTKAGSINNNIMTSNLQIYTDGSGREYIAHTAAGTGAAVMAGGYATWKFHWTSPSSPDHAICFHTAVNRTNNDNTQNGDSIFLSSMKVLQKPTGLHSIADPDGLRMYPNPAVNHLFVESVLPGIETVEVYDLGGRLLLSQKFENKKALDLSSLHEGNYMLSLGCQGRHYTRLFTKL